MKTSNTTTCTAGDFGQSSLRLDALLIYEDRSTGLRARRAFQHVLEQLGVEVDFTVELWRFELLSEPTVRNWVLNKTVEVDIIFVAAHGQRELPEAVLTLLKQWFTRKSDDPRALAVSLDSSVRETASTNQLLASLQAAAGPDHQHSSQLPAQLQGRQSLYPGP